MKKSSFLSRLTRRVFKHFISTLFVGLPMLFFAYLVYTKTITVGEWASMVGTLLGLYFTFFKKDDNKVISKPEDFKEMKRSAYVKEDIKGTDTEAE